MAARDIFHLFTLRPANSSTTAWRFRSQILHASSTLYAIYDERRGKDHAERGWETAAIERFRRRAHSQMRTLPFVVTAGEPVCSPRPIGPKEPSTRPPTD